MIDAIRRDSERGDALQRQGRDLLVDAVHRAADQGLSQREIAQAVGRSQPEVSRLLRQARPGPLSLRIAQSRQKVLDVLAEYGVTDARVFGSVATRKETPESDVDILIDSSKTLGLGTLARLERELTEIIGADVDVVPTRGLPERVRERALAESVRL